MQITERKVWVLLYRPLFKQKHCMGKNVQITAMSVRMTTKYDTFQSIMILKLLLCQPSFINYESTANNISRSFEHNKICIKEKKRKEKAKSSRLIHLPCFYQTVVQLQYKMKALVLL